MTQREELLGKPIDYPKETDYLPDGRVAVDVMKNKRLTAADSGIVQRVKAVNIWVMLPPSGTKGVWIVQGSVV